MNYLVKKIIHEVRSSFKSAVLEVVLHFSLLGTNSQCYCVFN